MTKTEYKDINEAPEENNLNFSVLINTPNIEQNAFKGQKSGFSVICTLYVRGCCAQKSQSNIFFENTRLFRSWLNRFYSYLI